MTARIRIPAGNALIAAIHEQQDATYGVTEHHIGKTWVPIVRNPCNVRVVGQRPGVTL